VCEFEKWSLFIDLINIVNWQLEYAAFGKVLVKRAAGAARLSVSLSKMGRNQSGRVRDGARASGHDSWSSFVRAFRKSYGCDPSEYRAPG
jgi:AraC-like DNA-binding protein